MLYPVSREVSAFINPIRSESVATVAPFAAPVYASP